MKALKLREKIGLVEGVRLHAKDDAVRRAIKSAQRKLSGSSPMTLVVKNEDGQIYRRFLLSGLAQELQLADRFAALGLVDETLQGGRRPRDVWAVWGGGRDLSLVSVLAGLATT